MTGKTHKVGGVCAGVITGAMILHPPYTFDKIILTGALLAGSIIGSLMPDIDHAGSTVGHHVKWLSSFISRTFGHRGITHAPLFHIIVTILLLLMGGFLTDFPKLMYICLVMGLFVGGISHLILDMMTVAGIPIFYPFCKKKYRIAKFTTGKQETIAQIIVVVCTFLIVKYLIF